MPFLLAHPMLSARLYKRFLSSRSTTTVFVRVTVVLVILCLILRGYMNNFGCSNMFLKYFKNSTKCHFPLLSASLRGGASVSTTSSNADISTGCNHRSGDNGKDRACFRTVVGEDLLTSPSKNKNVVFGLAHNVNDENLAIFLGSTQVSFCQHAVLSCTVHVSNILVRYVSIQWEITPSSSYL
jgi:hypothetical protein